MAIQEAREGKVTQRRDYRLTEAAIYVLNLRAGLCSSFNIYNLHCATALEMIELWNASAGT